MSQSDSEIILEYVRNKQAEMLAELEAYEDAYDDWAWGLRKDKPEPPKWLAELEGESAMDGNSKLSPRGNLQV